MGGTVLGGLLMATVRFGDGGNNVYWLGQRQPRSCRRKLHSVVCRVRDGDMGLETLAIQCSYNTIKSAVVAAGGGVGLVCAAVMACILTLASAHEGVTLEREGGRAEW
jgi:hypothetical protein